MLDTVRITFFDTASGEEHDVQAEVGKHLLDVAIDNNIELEGACGGELAWRTAFLTAAPEASSWFGRKAAGPKTKVSFVVALARSSTDVPKAPHSLSTKHRDDFKPYEDNSGPGFG